VSEVTIDPLPVAQLGEGPRRFSRLAIVAFILATIAPILLSVGDWALVSSSTSQSNGSFLLEIVVDIIVGAAPMAGGILGIVVVATIRRKGLAGRGLAVASIVVGFGVAFLVLPLYFTVLFLQYLTVHHVG
jgi:hypothetical protein